MAQLFNGRVYGGSPYPSAEVNYEYTRDGANMKYHFWGRVYLESSGGWYYNNLRLKLYLNGSDIYTKDCKSSSKGWSIDFDSGWHTVSNKTSGTTPFYFSVKDTQNSGWCNYTSGTYQLDVAPAYTSITGFSVAALNESAVRFSWSAAHTVDYVWYSTNNGSNWSGVDVSDGTSGSFDVGGLAANTGYNFKIRVRRKDSQLTTDSGAYWAATYNWPHITSTPDFTIGNSLTIKFYNPLGRSISILVTNAAGSETQREVDKTLTGEQVSGYNDAAWQDFWYAGIPASKSGSYKVRLVCSEVGINNIYNGGTYNIKQSDDEKPTFNSNYIINITNNLHADISGNNKFIKNHNSLSGTITPMMAQKSATPDYYSISSSGLSTVTKTYSNSNQNFDLGNMSVNAFNVTAVDKRGMSRTATVYIDLIDYYNPGVSSSNIVRQDGIGTKAILSFVGVYTNWSGLLQTNAIQTIKYRYKLSSANTYGAWRTLPNNAVLNSTNGIWTLDCVLDDTFTSTEQYDLQLQISDLLETIETGIYTISTANALLWRDLTNKRIGVGKKPSKTLDVAGDINADNALYINGTKMIWYE